MKTFILLIATILAGCTKMDSYDLDAISNPVVRGNTPRVLTFTLQLESAMHSPGAQLKIKPDGAHLTLVRCRVGADCPADLPAKPGTGANYEIPLPSDISSQIFIDGKSKSLSVPNQ